MFIKNLISLLTAIFILTSCNSTNSMYNYLKNFITSSKDTICKSSYEECISNQNFNLPHEMALKHIDSISTLCDRNLMPACRLAYKTMAEACHKSNDLDVCFTFAQIESRHGDADYAISLVAKACKGGLEKACLQIKESNYKYSQNKIKELTELISQKCKNENSSSCYELALLNKKSNQFEAYLLKACKLGEIVACTALKKKIPKKNTPFKSSKSFKTIQEEIKTFNKIRKDIIFKCNEGNGNACLLFANLLHESILPQDKNMHKHYLKKACDLKNFTACMKIESIAPVTKEKISSLKHLCSDSNERTFEETFSACKDYYFLLLRDNRNHDNTYKNFIEKQCKTAPRACTALALLYLSENNYSKYNKLFTESCSAGIGISCFELAMEKLLKEDIVGSKVLLQKSCAIGMKLSCDFFQTLSNMKNNSINEVLQSECLRNPIMCWYLGVQQTCQDRKEPFSCISSPNITSNKNFDKKTKALMSQSFLSSEGNSLYKFKYALVLKNFGEIKNSKTILENLCKTEESWTSLTACYTLGMF